MLPFAYCPFTYRSSCTIGGQTSKAVPIVSDQAPKHNRLFGRVGEREPTQPVRESRRHGTPEVVYEAVDSPSHDFAPAPGVPPPKEGLDNHVPNGYPKR